MEGILIIRLSMMVEEIKTISLKAQDLSNNLNTENLDQAKIQSSKLKSILSRFSAELYNYFNICNQPDADEISNFTTYQLQGEEILAKLDVKLKSKFDNLTMEGILKHLSLIISTKEEAIRITQQPCKSDASEIPYTTETLHIKDATNMERPGPSKNKFFNSKSQFKNVKKQQHYFKLNTNKNLQERKSTKRNFDQKKEEGNYVSEKRRKLWNCIFCNDSHFNADCDKVKTISDRKAKLNDRCFICFRNGHTQRQCERKKKCKFCGKYGVHNQALCPNKFQQKAK